MFFYELCRVLLAPGDAALSKLLLYVSYAGDIRLVAEINSPFTIFPRVLYAFICVFAAFLCTDTPRERIRFSSPVTKCARIFFCWWSASPPTGNVSWPAICRLTAGRLLVFHTTWTQQVLRQSIYTETWHETWKYYFAFSICAGIRLLSWCHILSRSFGTLLYTH